MCRKTGNNDNTVLMPLNGRVRNIDKCIHDLVAVLNTLRSTETIACCCGHGKYIGSIILKDGRVLEIYPNQKVWEKHRKKHSYILK